MKKSYTILCLIFTISLIFGSLVYIQQPKITEADIVRNRYKGFITPYDTIAINSDNIIFNDFKVNEGIFYFNTLKYITAYNPNDKFYIDYKPTKNDVLIIGWNIVGDYLSLFDVKRHFLYQHNLKSKHLKQTSVPFSFYRAVQIDSVNFLFKTDKNDFEIFSLWNTNNKIIHNNDTLLKTVEKGGIITDGFFVKNKNGYIFHISYYLDEFICFSPNGTPKYSAKTVDIYSARPKTLNIGNKYKPDPQNQMIHPTAFCNDNYLFIYYFQSQG
ncbi:MAG: hypothetical protein MUE85_04970 [Microscillaceae bacterium]|jgi:hypothetical protein|nr:hypothetical protein [Microscillaceae bacterium]